MLEFAKLRGNRKDLFFSRARLSGSLRECIATYAI